MNRMCQGWATAVVIGLSGAAACIGEPGGSLGYYTDEPTEPVVTDMWCVKATGAKGQEMSGEWVHITTAEGNTIGGCFVMCPFEHDIMVQGEIDETIGPSDPLYDHWQYLRGKVYESAIHFCEERVDQLEAGHGPIDFTGTGALSCEDAANGQDIYLSASKQTLGVNYCAAGGATFTTTATGGGSGGSGGATTGEPSGGPDLYGLSSYSEVIDCSGFVDIACDVDRDFVDYIVTNPEVLWDDDHLVGASSSPLGLEWAICGSDSLSYALGLRANDVVTHVEGFPVTNWEEIMGVWGYVVEGGEEDVTVDFIRGGRNYTLTLTKSDACADFNDPCGTYTDCCSGMFCNTSGICVYPT